MKIDLVDMQLFLHVVEAGSISAGCQRAHLSLASASERIRGMEDQIGMALLVRGRRGVQPTPAGQALVHHARLVLQQIDRMRGELGEHSMGLKGNIRLLCNTSALTEFLPQAIGQFMADHPNVDIELEERLSYDIVNSIRDGLADIGIVADYAESADLETYPFYHDRLVVVASSENLDEIGNKDGTGVSLGSIADLNFIGLTGDSALHRFLSLQAARIGKALRMRVRLRSFDAVCRMVENKIGISIIPETSAKKCMETMNIRIIPLSDPWATRQLKICVRKYSDLPRYTRKLVDRLTTVS